MIQELSGRVITVEFAKRLKRPSPPPPESPPPGETRYKLYVSNLAWKVRANNLREFFAANFKPVSARVVFNNPSGNSSGYGFVSFATREEAETAISELNGKVSWFASPVALTLMLSSFKFFTLHGYIPETSCHPANVARSTMFAIDLAY